MLTCFSPAMTTPEFLEDGEWLGFYSMSFKHNMKITFDPPMQGIRFTSTLLPGDPRIFRLAASGTDGIGPFTLEGAFDSKSGRFSAKKTYTNTLLGWTWTCMMTPFGIVGTWGSDNWGGWLWLWKKEWTKLDDC